MKNLWSDTDAEAMVSTYAAKGINRDLALRTYTTRLLGGDPRLVLHGGGNTSVKTTVSDLVGDEWDVLCVKGSGWDMGIIEPAGLPAVKIAPLLKARKLTKLSDEDMVTLQRANLIDPASPNPSVEAAAARFHFRTSSSITPIRPAFWRLPTLRTAWRSAQRCSDRKWGWCPM